MPQVAGITFSDSGSAHVPKVLNPGPDPAPAIFQIWASDSCSDSGYNYWSNRNLHMFLLKKRPYRLLLLPKRKIDPGSGSGFSQIFDSGSGSKRKSQNPAGFDSGTPDTVSPLTHAQSNILHTKYPWCARVIFVESESRARTVRVESESSEILLSRVKVESQEWSSDFEWLVYKLKSMSSHTKFQTFPIYFWLYF